MTLPQGERNRPYAITAVKADQEEMKEFLFTLGCFPGGRITLISSFKSNYIIHIRDSRYSMDEELARSIEVRELENDVFPGDMTRAV